MLKSNIYKSKLFDIQHFASLVLDVFYKLLRKKVVFLEALCNTYQLFIFALPILYPQVAK